MGTAAQQVLPIAITGEYRADAAFRALSRDLGTAKGGAAGAQAGMASLSQASASLAQGLKNAGSNVIPFNRNVGQTRQLFTGLSFQLNDIATGLASGQSPFTILAQQGGQVFQVLQMGPGGVGGSLQAIKAQLASFLTPARAVALGLTAAAAAAYLLYDTFRDKAPSAEQALETHSKLLGIVKTAYRDAGKAAGEFFDQSKAITLLQAQQSLIALQANLREAVAQGAGKTTKIDKDLTSMGEIMWDDAPRAGATAFAELNSEIERFNNLSGRGAQDVQTFRDTIASIGAAAAQTNPELAKAAAEVLKNTTAMGELAVSTMKAEAMLRMLTGTATQADRKLLGLSIKPTANAYQQLIERTKDRIEQLQLEAKYAGETGNAILGLKLQQDAERAAKQEGIKVNQKVIDQLKQQLLLAAEQKSVAELSAKIKFDRDKLGMTEGEASVAETLRSANIDARSTQGEMLAAQLRVNLALTETRDLGRDALKGLISDLRAGKSVGEAFAGVLDKIASKLLDKGLDSALANMFGGGGGIFGGLFGGSGYMGTRGGTGLLGFGGLFADGGTLGAGKWGIAGERGPEIIKGPAQIIPASRTSMEPSLSFTYAPQYNVKGSGEEVDRLRAEIKKDREEFASRVVATVRDARSRRMPV